MIKIIPVAGTDLYCQHCNQGSPQPCYIGLDCRDGTLYASYSVDIGSEIPADVRLGPELRWPIPCLVAGAANGLLNRIRPLAETVVGGYEQHWNGHNMVAKYSPEALSAIDAISDMCSEAEDDEDNCVQSWRADDYFGATRHLRDANGAMCRMARDAVSIEIDGYGTITAETSDDELSKISKKITGDLPDNIVIYDLAEWLQDQREICRENTSRNRRVG